MFPCCPQPPKHPPPLQISEKYGLVYVVTKLGLLFVYDLETATAVYRNRISPDPIFLAANSDSTGGIMAINRCVFVCCELQPPGGGQPRGGGGIAAVCRGLGEGLQLPECVCRRGLRCV
jgi:hypothetical protein